MTAPIKVIVKGAEFSVAPGDDIIAVTLTEALPSRTQIEVELTPRQATRLADAISRACTAVILAPASDTESGSNDRSFDTSWWDR